MSSGQKKLIQNTREKVLSTDMNRRQDLNAQERAEIYRHLFDLRGGYSEELGGAMDVADIPDTIENPFTTGLGLRADIYEGLTVIPVQGTPSLHIVPGVVGMHDPDGQAGSSDPSTANPDDSVYKVLKDDGIDTNGVLVITDNPGGNPIRVDIIECQRAQVITEQDNRDIYNPATGLFTPTLVDKVEDGQLTYRVRAGTPGSGLPALEQGWLPLAIAAVPGGNSGVDDVTFWDVRPLVKDRSFAPQRGLRGEVFPLRNRNAMVDRNTVGGESRLIGVLEGEDPVTGNLAGGKMVADYGTTDYIDLQDANNLAGGFTPAANAIVYIWAAFPYGLPRWVRYPSAATAGGRRVPAGPKGIIFGSHVAPATKSTHGPPASPLTLPTGLGLATTTSYAALIAAVPSDGVGDVASCLMTGSHTYLDDFAGKLPSKAPANGSGVLAEDYYDFVSGTDFPVNAREVQIRVTAIISGAASGDEFSYSAAFYTLFSSMGGGLGAQKFCASQSRHNAVIQSGLNASITYTEWLPRLPHPFAADDLFVQVAWGVAGSVTGKASEGGRVIGWKVDD